MQGQIVVSVSIGACYANEELHYLDHTTGVTTSLRIGNFISKLLNSGMMRDGQAINIFFPELLEYCLTPHDRTYVHNIRTLTTFLMKIRDEKLVQIKKGNIGIDLFTILLNEGGDVYGLIEDSAVAEATMMDDIKTIYVAAVATTQISVNNLMKYLHMDDYKPVKDKLLAEVDTLLAFDAWDAEGNQINHDVLRDSCSYEKVQEGFEFTMMCFRESLRIEPPVGYTTSHTVTREVTLARGTEKELKIRAGDNIRIQITLLQHDVTQWGSRHNEFIPERFDSNSDHFNAPSGKHRHPYSFAPFLGGHRICLGKTFADTVAKKMIALVLKFYSLEHADPKMKKKNIQYDIFQMELPSIRFTFKKRSGT